MLLAPWFVVDKLRKHKIIGASFTLDAPVSLPQHGYREALALVLEKHIFPEWFIVRGAAAAAIFQPFSSVGYHFFVHLARALQIGSVRVGALPFALVTGISSTEHVGNTETLYGWDEYRGGLELMASFALPGIGPFERDELRARIEAFENTRMSVALRLHLGRGNWLDAWHLHRRLLARGCDVISRETRDELGSLAAIQAIVREAERAGYREIVMPEKLFSIAANVCKGASVALVPETDFDGSVDRPRALVGFGSAPEARNPRDLVLDAAELLRIYGFESDVLEHQPSEWTPFGDMNDARNRRIGEPAPMPSG